MHLLDCTQRMDITKREVHLFLSHNNDHYFVIDYGFLV